MKKGYLDRTPMIRHDLVWRTDEDGDVILYVKNKGFLKKLTQKILKKPEISYIHLDDMGCFIWKMIDGKITVEKIAKALHEEFRENAEPLYNRIISYFKTLEEYKFIEWKE